MNQLGMDCKSLQLIFLATQDGKCARAQPVGAVAIKTVVMENAAAEGRDIERPVDARTILMDLQHGRRKSAASELQEIRAILYFTPIPSFFEDGALRLRRGVVECRIAV
jgi:hypothetical protein